MRFAHYLPAFPQPGGAAAAARGLVDAGEREGHNDEILSYGQIGVHEKNAATPLASRLLLSSPLPIPFLADPVSRHLSELDDLDGLILHGVFTPSCSRLSMQTRRRRPGLAMIAFPHDAYDSGLFSTKSAIKHSYWALVERPYLQRSHLVVVTTVSHGSLLRDAGVQTATVVAPPGLGPGEVALALDTLARRSRRPVGIPLRFLVLGRWDIHEKGLDLLCEAASDPSLRHRITVRLVGPEYGARSPVDKF